MKRSLDAIAVFSADRPHLARRYAESYLTHHTHPQELLLMDDSRDPTPAIPDLAAHLARTYGVPARYADRPTRHSYISHLTRLGIPPDVAAFTLLGDSTVSFTAGANRNAALLDTIGRQFLMADDDTVATTAVPTTTTDNPPTEGEGHYDPSDIDFFPTGQARHAAIWSPIDLVTEVATLLGSPTGDEATIRMTTCGVVGDSGYYSPSHLLWMGPSHIYEKLRQSESRMKTAFTSRDVIRIVPRLTVTHKTVCMATTLGLDHTHPLPPFLPIARNEDGFFGNLMIRAFPAARTAYLPCAVLHDPPGAREYGRLPHQPQTIRIPELLILLMAACPTGTLDALGHFLIEISGDHLEAFAGDVVRKSRASLLRLIEHRHAAALTPATDAWQHQFTLLRSSLAEFIESPHCWQPADIAPHEVSRIVGLTGRMLLHWTEILDAARRLATDGIRITRS